MALVAYATESDIPILSATQLDLVEKIIAALLCIDELTNSVSADSASVSVIIPFVKIMIKTLEKHHNDSGVRTMKKEILLSVKRRFSNIESNVPLVIARLLDPCFNDRILSGAIQQAEAKRMLIEELEKIDDAGSLEPPSKRFNADITELRQSFNEILEESGSSAESENTVIGSVMEQYVLSRTFT